MSQRRRRVRPGGSGRGEAFAPPAARFGGAAAVAAARFGAAAGALAAGFVAALAVFTALAAGRGAALDGAAFFVGERFTVFFATVLSSSSRHFGGDRVSRRISLSGSDSPTRGRTR